MAGPVNRSTPISTSATPTGRAGLATSIFYYTKAPFAPTSIQPTLADPKTQQILFRILSSRLFLLDDTASNFGENILVSRHRQADPPHLRTSPARLDIYIYYGYLLSLGSSFLQNQTDQFAHFLESTATRKSHHGAVNTSTARRLQPSDCWQI